MRDEGWKGGVARWREWAGCESDGLEQIQKFNLNLVLCFLKLWSNGSDLPDLQLILRSYTENAVVVVVRCRVVSAHSWRAADVNAIFVAMLSDGNLRAIIPGSNRVVSVVGFNFILKLIG